MTNFCKVKLFSLQSDMVLKKKMFSLQYDTVCPNHWLVIYYHVHYNWHFIDYIATALQNTGTSLLCNAKLNAKSIYFDRV